MEARSLRGFRLHKAQEIFLKEARSTQQVASYIYVWGKDRSNNLYRINTTNSNDKNNYIVAGSSYTVNDVALSANGQVLYYALNNNGGVWKSSSGPGSGTQTGLSSVVINSVATSGTGDIVYAAGPGGLWKSTNAGTNWLPFRNDNCKQVILSPGFSGSTSNVLVLRNDGLKIYYSSDAGTTWSEVQGSLPTPIYSIAGVAGSPSKLFAATEYGSYQIDAPASAPTMSTVTAGAVPTLTWDAFTGATAYHVKIFTEVELQNCVGDYRYVVGTSFAPTNLNPNTSYWWTIAGNNFIGEGPSSSYGTFTTTTSGSISLSVSNYLGGDGNVHPRLSWIPDGQGTTFYIYRYSCTYGAGDCGNWPYPFLAQTTGTSFDDPSVDVTQKGQTSQFTFYYEVRSKAISNKVTRNSPINEEDKMQIIDNLPRVTSLKENYPNPFNPVTRIEYDLAQDVHVSIKVYDVLGKEVAVLANEQMEAGTHTAAFDASSLPSGVYFYRMTAGRFTDIKKMMLLK